MKHYWQPTLIVTFCILISQCVNKIQNRSDSMDRKILKIKWQRLLVNEETCPRCSNSEKEIDKAVDVLKKSLDSLSIEVLVEKGVCSVLEFKKKSS